jgi:predicted permease
MDPLPSDPLKQPVPLKLLLVALCGVAYLIAALAIAQLYSRVLGLVMLAPVFIFVLVSVYRITPEQNARIATALKKQEQSAFWRFMRLVQIGALALLAVGLLAWLYERWQ